ncbi:MAG: ribbon-helix-helix protein, CopG family [Nitrospirae bacterium]|nr:ribbon-helix-helix protein, CopG family [Nitrospirota bacterium]
MSHTIVHTTDMKTAISIPDELFESVNKLAAKSGWSRSQVFVEAVKEYIEKRRTRRILDALNRAYAGSETGDEVELREMGKRAYAKRLKAKRERW